MTTKTTLPVLDGVERQPPPTHTQFCELIGVQIEPPSLSALSHYPRGGPLDRRLVHMVESVVIEWSHQIQDVLKKNSAQPLLDGKNPGPLVELDFWVARKADLESVLDQVRISCALSGTPSEYHLCNFIPPRLFRFKCYPLGLPCFSYCMR